MQTNISLNRAVRGLVTVLLLCGAASADAHIDGIATGGFMAGFSHPFGGLDHLLAMVAVGIWGAWLGRPLVWALPLTFPLLMVAGGVLGIAGVSVPYVEPGIAASVVILGLAILAAWRAPLAVALVVVGVFGVLHGYAHGLELPKAAAPQAYTAGFVLATGLLHLFGIALGTLKVLPRGPDILRATGAAIAAAGVWILIGMPGVA
jgi:urease accessory protein